MAGSEPSVAVASRKRARALTRIAVFGSAAAISAGSAASAQSDEQLAYGRHLASVCAPCHRVTVDEDGLNFVGTASIIGLDSREFLAKLAAKESDPNPVMRQVVAGLGEQEREALAAYLGQLKAE